MEEMRRGLLQEGVCYRRGSATGVCLLGGGSATGGVCYSMGSATGGGLLQEGFATEGVTM